MSLDIVAEGVEHQTQVEVLAAIGVTKLQGWRFSKAVDVEGLIAYAHEAERLQREGPAASVRARIPRTGH
ncbi:hypothetical protein BH23ACT9_BH23ACT9_02020 [soil metagenome]